MRAAAAANSPLSIALRWNLKQHCFVVGNAPQRGAARTEVTAAVVWRNMSLFRQCRERLNKQDEELGENTMFHRKDEC
jgi:hypothetical protein